MSLGTFFSGVESTIGNFFTAVGQILSAFFNALAVSVAQNGGKVLMDAAVAAVATAETQGGTPQQKFAAATAAVLAKLEAEGIPVVMNAVNGAIEAAVASMKAAHPVAAPAQASAP